MGQANQKSEHNTSNYFLSVEDGHSSPSHQGDPQLQKKKKFDATEDHQDDPWGWFEDLGSPPHPSDDDFHFERPPLERALTLPNPVTSPPVYVLESSISSQRLWYETAGRRPRQPPNEREFYEQLWAKNFEKSAVVYDGSGVEDKSTDLKGQILIKNVDGDVIYKGKGSFSNAVSKSFENSAIPSLTIQVPRFRTRRMEDGKIHAEYLVVITLGTVTFGIWRRHSEFKDLALQVLAINEKSGKKNKFKNALLSWQCLINRQRWFRCLEKDYLGLKCFLLERFMHDLLFESSSPDLIRTFLGV